MQTVSLEHIDPIRHSLICGLRNDLNEILASLSYNARKTNRFVPYRVCEHPAPVTFGDMCEFLIEDEWVVCEFGGDIWWAESNRVGNATNTRRCGLRTWSEEDMVLRREILKKAREARNLSDNHFSEMGKKCKGKAWYHQYVDGKKITKRSKTPLPEPWIKGRGKIVSKSVDSK